MIQQCSTENKGHSCVIFDDIIFLSLTGLAQKFAYVHNSLHIQFLSKPYTTLFHRY